MQPVCAEAQQELLSAVGNTVPDDLRSAAEGPDDGTLTAPELAAALGGMANGKAPGPDGLPYEVYKVLWELLGPRLCAAAAASYLDAAGATDSTAMAAALPPSWLEGLITLIYKGNNLDKATLTSYRPITLLNTENLLQGRHIKQSPRAAQYSSPAIAVIADILARGQARGQFRSDLRARDVYLLIVSTGYFLMSNRYTLSAFLGERVDAPEQTRAWQAFVTDAVLRTVLNSPTGDTHGHSHR